ICAHFVYILRIDLLAVPPTSHYNMDARVLRNSTKALGASAKSNARDFNNRFSASLLVFHDFSNRKVFIIQDSVIAMDNWPKITNQVFMRQYEACLPGS